MFLGEMHRHMSYEEEQKKTVPSRIMIQKKRRKRLVSRPKVTQGHDFLCVQAYC